MWNVLAVDDSATSLALLERMIVRLGHRPLLANCGVRALAVCAVERPDIILLDVMMPDIDGWELALRLRAQDRLRAVPIVFQSSLEAPEDIARYEREIVPLARRRLCATSRTSPCGPTTARIK